MVKMTQKPFVNLSLILLRVGHTYVLVVFFNFKEILACSLN